MDEKYKLRCHTYQKERDLGLPDVIEIPIDGDYHIAWTLRRLLLPKFLFIYINKMINGEWKQID